MSVRGVVVTKLVVVVLVGAGLVVSPPVAAPAAAATLPGANPAAVLARLTEAQRVGQLLVVSAALDGVSDATKTAITRYHAGSVFLAGRSSAGVDAVRSMTDGLQSLATSSATGGVPLLVATDQEGGYVQTLSGDGFSRIPTAVTQGSWSASTLRARATTWARQLAAAGVTLNLAPVLDTVPPGSTDTNQPIGRWDREYGTTPGRVTTAGMAVVRGMHASGVETTVKHFPGLGRADGNTDTKRGVKDTVTTRHDSYLSPFATATRTGDAGFVMVSHATYTRIDAKHRAVFSPTVLHDMIRGDLGFTGVVMSDAMDAAAVRDLSPATRAVRFVAAGGDLVLTGRPADVPTMAKALLARAQSDGAFRARVDASCLRILEAKQRAGVLGGEVAAALAGGGLYLAERTAAGHVTVRVRTSSSWSAATALDGDAVAAPAVAGLPDGSGVEVATVTSKRTVAVRTYVPGAASAPWADVGGSATSAPAVAVSPAGAVVVAVRGASHDLRLRERTPSGDWGSWTSVGGVLSGGAPGLAWMSNGDLAVFVVGDTQRVYRKLRHAGSWSGWQSLGGVADSGPAVAVHGSTVTLLVRAHDATLAAKTLGSSSGWTRVAGRSAVNAPVVAITSAGSLTGVVEGRDGRLHLGRRTSSGWSWSTLPFD